MGKLLPMLLLVVAINLSIVVFIGGPFPGSTLWAFVNSPGDWNSLGLIALMTESLTAVGFAAIAIGTIFGSKSDTLIFATITGVMFSFGISYADLFNRLNATDILSSSHSNIALLIVSPLIITYLYVIIRFWRNVD